MQMVAVRPRKMVQLHQVKQLVPVRQHLRSPLALVRSDYFLAIHL
jgi:hypothetical protein